MRDVCIFSLRGFYAKKFTHLTKLLIIALQTNNTSRKCWVHIINSNTRAEFSKYFHILSNFEATLSKCCWNFKSNRTYIKSFSLSKGLLQGGSDFKWKIIRNGLFVNFFFLKKIMIRYVNWLFSYNIIPLVGTGSCLMVPSLHSFNFDYRARLDKLSEPI